MYNLIDAYFGTCYECATQVILRVNRLVIIQSSRQPPRWFRCASPAQ